MMCMYMYTTHLIRKLISCRIVRDFLIICNNSQNQARRPGFERGGYPTRYDFAKVLFPPRPRLPPETNLIRNFRTSSNLKRLALSFSLLFPPAHFTKFVTSLWRAVKTLCCGACTVHILRCRDNLTETFFKI